MEVRTTSWREATPLRPRLRLTIRRKILTAALVMTLLTAGLGAFALHELNVTGRLVADAYDHTLMSIDHAHAVASDFAQMQALLANRRLAAADAGRAAALDARQATLADIMAKDLAIAGERALSPAVAPAARVAQDALAAWIAQRATLLGNIIPADTPTGIARNGIAPNGQDWDTLDLQRAAVKAGIDALIDQATNAGLWHREQAVAESRAMRQVTLMFLIASIALSAGVAMLLARRIMAKVGAASDAASAIANGKLTTVIPHSGSDELGQLLRAMARMRDAIRSMVEREVAQRRSAQGWLADALENSPEGVLLVGPEGRLVATNARLAAFFPALVPLLVPGTRVARLVGAAMVRRLFAVERADADPPARTTGRSADDRPSVDRPSVDRPSVDRPSVDRHSVERQLLTLSPGPIEARLCDGRWLRISRSATRDGGTIAICSDITAVKQRESDLQQANLYLDVALNNMTQGLCLFGPDQRLRLANQRFGQLMGVPADMLHTGTALQDILAASVRAGNDGSAALASLGNAPPGAERGPARLVHPLRADCVVDIAQAPLADGGWVATFEDVTARRQTEERISFLARHDPLTGLANRAELAECLQDAVAALDRGERFAVMCLDLDHFKSVNDLLGHSTGDRLLQAAAGRLASAMREHDTVCRLGADEFAIIVRDIERPEDAWELAQRLLAALAAPFDLDAIPITVAASLGIALAPHDASEGETLLKQADSALRRAKQDGRGSYRSFEGDMDARLQARRAMEMDLRRALASGQFALHYQPLVETRGQRVVGFEALLRWQHPETGMIPPAAFIPLSEEIGLIGPIGEWVLRTACAEAMGWPERLKVAVNVSPVQFQDSRLVEMVADALATSGLPPELLELEVTESVLLQNNAVTLHMLRQLHDMGVRISMDDFGTGYSSLSYLRSFPFDKIKIDQSFVRDLAGSTDAIAIIRAITALGLSLGMRTTAEGVETTAQLSQLCAEGCTELQGYLFSRPIPPEAVPALIDRINNDREIWQLDSAEQVFMPAF